MSERPNRPVILFPTPEKASRDNQSGGFSRIGRPPVKKQYDRLHPKFQVLSDALKRKTIVIQQSALGVNPDFALVFEVVGSVDNFYSAVKRCEGLEWMFDIDSDEILPDDDFYITKKGKKSEESLNGKLYCVMTNQQALEQLLSLWERYASGEENVFKWGFAGLRDVFTLIKNIRRWDATDRIAETGIVEFWQENLEYDGKNPQPFEIELFYRDNQAKRINSSNTVKREVINMGGQVLQECVINDIAYHALLVILPRASIQNLVEKYEEIELAQVDDIMFFRPTCQSYVESSTESRPMTEAIEERKKPQFAPVAALLDGMPLQNHILLKERIIVDDPDGYEKNYASKDRIHGTAMSSLAIYGDLNKEDDAINHMLYVRPIMKPVEVGPDSIEERIPENVLIVDLIHRAVKRIKEGDADAKAIAPEIQIINLSIGDPIRQLTTVMSPLARLIDFLAYRYKLLFIVSAGNHPNSLMYIQSSFSDFKARSIGQRNKTVWNAIVANQRHMKVLSPAESINSLSIGATYDDFCQTNETLRGIWAVSKGLPSPISAFGKGYRGIITPDLYYFGGRKFVGDNFSGGLKWFRSSSEPGCRAAAPYNNGTESGEGFSFGTSDAAAQITHEAVNCIDVLADIFMDETDHGIPKDYEALLVKGMLTHGASWDEIADELSRVTGSRVKQLSQWAGNGIPDIGLVKECTKERVTLIGFGALRKDQGDVFKLPLHIDFSSRLVKRKLTVTLSYFSPIVASKQAYRQAQLWFEVDDNGKGLIPDGSRQNSDWRAVRKGTLQHEIYIGEKPIVWNDEELKIKVSCKSDAATLKASEEIAYCIFVSFEVAQGLDIDLYSKVREQIQQRVTITQ